MVIGIRSLTDGFSYVILAHISQIEDKISGIISCKGL